MKHPTRISALAAVITCAAVLSGCGGTDPLPVAGTKPVRTEFDDHIGRHCVQVVYGAKVTLDCSFPPIENRLGSALKGFEDQVKKQADKQP